MRTLEQALKKGTVWLCGEAGATHTGLDSAINLVDIAVSAGFDAVKFQIVESAKCPHPDEIFNGYKCIDIWRQRELSQGEWKILKAYCDKKDIYSFVTITDVNQLDWFPSEMYKIRRRDINNFGLINAVGNACKWLQIDICGTDTLPDMSNFSKNFNLIINHTPIGYPAESKNEYLWRITNYKAFYFTVGYSSHTKSINNDLLALVLGVNILEKPIREHASESIAPEVNYALDLVDAKDYIQQIRDAEKALGK